MRYSLSKSSKDKLKGVHQDLVILVAYTLATSEIDFKITEGVRSVERQFELYKIGRELQDDIWVDIPGEIQVTWTMKSPHLLGKAVDLYPYPIPKNLNKPPKGYREKQEYLRRHFIKCAKVLKIPLRLLKKDIPHFELRG